mmetsp:Transcript_44351/g.106846  ORF Transcript_44351/g.106846 Transcript_44351/m.106846 type:complete len:349 (+) Transcript_44351:62-1108(+)
MRVASKKRYSPMGVTISGAVIVTILLLLLRTSKSGRATHHFYKLYETPPSTIATIASTVYDDSSASNSTGVSSVSSSASTMIRNCSLDSGGFFTDISENDWQLLKNRVHTRQNHFNPKKPKRSIQWPATWYQENFEPDFTCMHERRIGGMGDGPKWVCDPHRLMMSSKTNCLVYSIGSKGKYKFETAVLSEIGSHCEIHTFDPELKGKSFGKQAPKGVHYHNWGLMSEVGGKEAQAQFFEIGDKGNFKTMKESIEALGHVGREIDIFKIDCEGCEWTTYQDWFHAGATLRQILVEVHETPEDFVVGFFEAMQEHGYVTFHKEPNIQFGGGKCVEYAFLKLEDSFFEKG